MGFCDVSFVCYSRESLGVALAQTGSSSHPSPAGGSWTIHFELLMHMHVIRPGIQSAWQGAAMPDITILKYLPTSWKQHSPPPRPQCPGPAQIAAGPLPEPLPGPVAAAHLYPSTQAAQC